MSVTRKQYTHSTGTPRRYRVLLILFSFVTVLHILTGLLTEQSVTQIFFEEDLVTETVFDLLSTFKSVSAEPWPHERPQPQVGAGYNDMAGGRTIYQKSPLKV